MTQNLECRMEESAELGADRLSQLVHDLRHCLHVMRIGRELLAGSLDEDKRRDVCNSLDQEELKAMQLLDEFVELSRDRPDQN